MRDKLNECKFSLVPIKDKGYEGWHSLMHTCNSLTVPLCPEESEDMRKMIDAFISRHPDPELLTLLRTLYRYRGDVTPETWDEVHSVLTKHKLESMKPEST